MKLRFLGLLILVSFLLTCKKDVNHSTSFTPAPLDSVIRGADISFLPEIESSGALFTNSTGSKQPILDQLKAAGCNTIRLRIWHTPSTIHSSLEEVNAFSQQVKAKGMKVWLTVHFSDTWADPGSQTKPAAWVGLPLSLLKDSISNYCHLLVQQIQPDYFQLGNEINNGFLWETGRIGSDSNFYQLIRSASVAVRSESKTCKLMIHYAGLQGADVFFKNMHDHQIDFDMIGLSYYPVWHGKRIDSIGLVMHQLTDLYQKDAVIAETAYPFTLSWNDYTNNNVGLESQLIPAYPATPDGQHAFLMEVRNQSIFSTHGKGFCYWAPEWVAFKGPTSTSGSSWENQALWDFNNVALVGLKCFQQ